MSRELLDVTLDELAAGLCSRRVSPLELMDAVLDRIEATHGELNAFVAMHDRDRLLAAARAAEARIQSGDARPLEGIPLGVKDLEDTVDLPNTKGSRIHAGDISTGDTTQVARLKAAGAIVIGKTNAPEFGYTAITKNLVYGATHNPWDLERTPGGSSGGSSAAMAAGICPLVTASDGGGSIRIPASFTGCFGLKVSQGRVPRGPFTDWEYDDTIVSGPLTKTVADAALFLDQVAGCSPCDPNSLPHAGISYARALEESLPAGTRFGFSPDLGYGVVQSDVAARVEEAAHIFEKLGHRLIAIEGGPPALGHAWGLLGAFMLASKLHHYLPERKEEFGRTFIRGVEAGLALDAPTWGEMARKRIALNAWCAELFGQVDFLITPTVPYDPPPARGPFPSETEGRRQPPAGVAAFTIPFNLSWHPAATLRCGFSQAGLPVGLQIVGPRHRDDLVLRAALAFENEHPAHPDWPALG
ncbi:MAG TPA: amidase [Myxococcota bacterium]|jgi:aspartyl-tRNA(Asn)/glutamyl-tRNA(Gln) amidotransferase subunit A|nr:amidase [Myxococcota bacterium]MDP7075182.1 amidase [Myxococcota bacterium]MDP7298843.1 amidase [Myxococcota bacterium]HJO25172.1 amidase [Myxococcota bacterium]